MAPGKSASERLKIVNETKLKLIENHLMDDPSTKVLWIFLNNYHANGTECHCELPLKLRYDIPRKYVVDLWNDAKKMDTVVIKAVE